MSPPLDTSLAVTVSIKYETPLFVRMFKPRFAELVRSKRKRQTVRPTPKRMPRPGDRISLRKWADKPYRSRQLILCDSIITQVDQVFIYPNRVSVVKSDPFPDYTDREHFARCDGFASWAELVEWFDAEHGLPFSGICIHWA